MENFTGSKEDLVSQASVKRESGQLLRFIQQQNLRLLSMGAAIHMPQCQHPRLRQVCGERV